MDCLSDIVCGSAAGDESWPPVNCGIEDCARSVVLFVSGSDQVATKAGLQFIDLGRIDHVHLLV
jgi:hypothetical protein